MSKANESLFPEDDVMLDAESESTHEQSEFFDASKKPVYPFTVRQKMSAQIIRTLMGKKFRQYAVHAGMLNELFKLNSREENPVEFAKQANELLKGEPNAKDIVAAFYEIEAFLQKEITTDIAIEQKASADAAKAMSGIEPGFFGED